MNILRHHLTVRFVQGNITLLPSDLSFLILLSFPLEISPTQCLLLISEKFTFEQIGLVARVSPISYSIKYARIADLAFSVNLSPGCDRVTRVFPVCQFRAIDHCLIALYVDVAVTRA